VAGRYTTHEYDVHAFDRMVAERYMAALRAESPVAPGGGARQGEAEARRR
jgi:hypothetical protein